MPEIIQLFNLFEPALSNCVSKSCLATVFRTSTGEKYERDSAEK